MKRTLYTLASVLVITLLLVPSVSAEQNPRCVAMETSALTPPDWYVAECMGAIAVPQAAAPGPWLVPGDPAYYVTLFSTNAALARRLLTAPLPTNTYVNIGPSGAAPLSLFAVDFDNAASVLWAIDSACNPTTGVCSGRNFGTIDQATGAFTVVGAVSAAPGPAAGSNFAGLRFDPSDGTVYMTTISPTGVSELWTLNLTTGAAALRGTMGTGLIIDIAISSTGQMFALNISDDILYSVNKTTGALTPIGPTGFNYNFAQGMDFDVSDNTLYVFGQGTAAGLAHIGRANLTTGAVTIVTVTGEEMEGAVKVPAFRMTATSLAVDSAQNNVMEPGETVIVAPTWRNDASATQNAVTGTFSAFAGPAGGTYTIDDATAAYGDIAGNATGTCTSDCYGVTASATTRPQQHWDTTVLETLSVPGQTKTWTLHVGQSFTDVPTSNPFYRFVEVLLHRGITGGCAPDTYCPSNSTAREQMAVFALVAKEGVGYQPPACAPPNLFSDVPETSPFCRFIEELANRQIVSGCAPNLYCPTASVTREQMAIFVLRTLDPTLNPPACVAGSEMFNDVPASSPFCRWIEELARRAVVSGCGGGAYCPSGPVTREQMGVFIALTFLLQLY